MVGPKDGSFTLEFKSATAKGLVERVVDREEQIASLRAISQRFLPQHMDAFEAAIERSLSRTAVYRITLLEAPVGKRKQYDENGDEIKYIAMIELDHIDPRMIANNLTPSSPIHPGEMIKDELEYRGITQRNFAESVGS